jgi:3'-5' exoribonuclease
VRHVVVFRYKPDASPEKIQQVTEAGRLLGHVTLGLELLRERAAQVPALGAERMLALAHCVLCHHGPDGAPGRRFGSAEALALYRLNALDAAVKGALERGLP